MTKSILLKIALVIIAVQALAVFPDAIAGGVDIGSSKTFLEYKSDAKSKTLQGYVVRMENDVAEVEFENGESVIQVPIIYLPLSAKPGTVVKIQISVATPPAYCEVDLGNCKAPSVR